MRKKTVRISLLGAGTVGGGVLTLLEENADLLYAQTGCEFEVRHVVVRSLEKPRPIPIKPELLTTDAQRAVLDPQVDVVIEVLGGLEPARTLIQQALEAGKHVITANKMVMALAGDSLITLAHKHKVRLLYEASVAGSLPILTSLRGALAGNRIHRVVGIVNSTTHFILHEMEQALAQGVSAEEAYHQALQKAQALGYAEADPTSDVEGYDAQYKMAILARMAFLQYVPTEAVYREGISHISGRDLMWAQQLGYRIKLLGVAERLVDGRLNVRVHPALVPVDNPLCMIEGAFSAIWLEGNGFQKMLMHSMGAGARPTASAVIGDLIEIARYPKPSSIPDPSLLPGETAPIEALTFRYFVRAFGQERDIESVRRTVVEIGASTLHQEQVESAHELVAIVSPTQESLFQERIAKARAQTACTIQAIRLLDDR